MEAGPRAPQIPLPERYNYIALFLTLQCQLRCSFCINEFGGARRAARLLPGEEWIAALNRLRSRPDLPVSLQGGEPTLHPDFYRIVDGLRGDLALDLLTNLQFDLREFMARVPPERLRREAPYASIRVSYHPEVMRLDDLKAKVLRLLAKGYSVGIWAVRHPAWIEELERARADCERSGIDFRLKEFLGSYQGKMLGTYRHPEAILGGTHPPVLCRTSELLIGPDGSVFRCHSDLYAGREPIGRICDPAFRIEDRFRACRLFGSCNPCDVKIKTNRFQEFGHTSVEIRRGDSGGSGAQ